MNQNTLQVWTQWAAHSKETVVSTGTKREEGCRINSGVAGKFT